MMEATWNGSIFVPRYASPRRPNGATPPSPPAESRLRRRRLLERAARSEASYTGRLEFPTWRGRLEDFLHAIRIGTPSAMTGGMSSLSGIETQLLGASVPANPPTTTNLLIYLRGDKGTFQDTGAVTPAVAAADPVKLWQDQSGNGNHWTMTTATEFPLIGITLNGLNTVQFDGSNDDMTRTSVSIGTSVTIYSVIQLPALAARAIIGGDQGEVSYYLNASGKQEVDNNNVSLIAAGTSVISTGVFVQLNMTYNASTGAWVFRMAKAVDSNGTGGTITGINFDRLGRVHNNSGFFSAFRDYMAAILVYGAIHDLTTKQSVESWITDTWGV